MQVRLETPQPLEKLRKIYKDNVTFISSVNSYPLVDTLEFKGDYLSAMKKRSVPVKIGKKVDKEIAKYRSRLTKIWDANQADFLKSITLDGLKKSLNKADDTSLEEIAQEPDSKERTKKYRQYLLDHKDEIIRSGTKELKEDLRNVTSLSFTSVYLLGKNRGQAMTNQELSDDLTKKDRDTLDEKEQWNDDYLDGLTDDLYNNYVDALGEDYDSDDELLDTLKGVGDSERSRLPLFAAAVGSVLLAAGMRSAADDVRQVDPETGELTDEPVLDPDTDLPIGDVITGGVWHTSQDDSVCDGCDDEDGQWMTWDEFEQEAGTNDCLTRCRCIELFEPSDEPQDEEKSVKSGSLTKQDEHKKNTIAVDLDGTLLETGTADEPLGKPKPGAKEVLQRLKDEGYTIVIYTSKAGYTRISNHLKAYGIPFDHININPDEPYIVGSNLGKPSAEAYIDNRALEFKGDWEVVYQELKRRGGNPLAKIAPTTISRDIERVKEIHGSKLDDKFLQVQAKRADELRDLHSDITQRIVTDLRTLLPNADISSRTKTRYSMVEKLGRKDKYKSVDDIKDITGIRIIVNHLDDITIDGGVIDAIRGKYNVVEQQNYIDHPQPNGYRSYHLTIKDAETGRPVEIQVRTKNQDAWALWSYDLTYKPKSKTFQELSLADKETVRQYQSDVSDYLYTLDQDRTATKPECPDLITQVVKCFGEVTKGGAGSGSWEGQGQPRFQWTQAQKPEQAGIRQLEEPGRQLASRAQEAEKKITPLIDKLALTMDGTIRGREYRLKTEESLLRKMNEAYLANPALEPDKVASDIKDSVRYTMEFPDNTYTMKVSESLDALQKEGHTPVKAKNYWEQDDPYQGINVTMKSPEGHLWELQFHTPESYDLKQNKTHPVYEQFRVSPSPVERKSLYDTMVRMASTVAAPAGVMALGELARQMMKAVAEGARYFAIRPDFNDVTSGLIRLRDEKSGMVIEYLNRKGVWVPDPELLSFLLGSEGVDEIDEKRAGEIMHDWFFAGKKVEKGGAGSGHFGHAGIPGQRGGSLPAGEGGAEGAGRGGYETTITETGGQRWLPEERYGKEFKDAVEKEIANAAEHLKMAPAIDTATVRNMLGTSATAFLAKEVVAIQNTNNGDKDELKRLEDKKVAGQTTVGWDNKPIDEAISFARKQVQESGLQVAVTRSSAVTKGIEEQVGKIAEQLGKQPSLADQNRLFEKIKEDVYKSSGSKILQSNATQAVVTNVLASAIGERQRALANENDQSIEGHLYEHRQEIQAQWDKQTDEDMKRARNAVEGGAASATVQSRQNYQNGRDWVKGNVSPWLLQQIPPVEWQAKRGNRSFYRPQDGAIKLATDDRPGTIPHEFMHHLERNIPQISNFFSEYYKARTLGETPLKLSRVNPGRSYTSDEYTRLDKFTTAYMGHTFMVQGYGGDRNERRQGGEIFSTAVGMLANRRDAAELYRRDPELFGITSAILKGWVPSPKPVGGLA